MIPKESISMREVRIETRQQSVLMALDARFPGCLPVDVPNRVKAETDMEVLRRWLRLAATASSIEVFQAGMD
jgi:hypothetical protein